MTPVAELKLVHRATWAAGDYAAVAEHIDEAPSRDLLARMDIQPGQDVLDVATGTGNLAIPAAAAGAQVVGLDLTPELFVTARRRAAEHDVVVDWVEGDAEDLPYDRGLHDPKPKDRRDGRARRPRAHQPARPENPRLTVARPSIASRSLRPLLRVGGRRLRRGDGRSRIGRGASARRTVHAAPAFDSGGIAGGHAPSAVTTSG